MAPIPTSEQAPYASQHADVEKAEMELGRSQSRSRSRSASKSSTFRSLAKGHRRKDSTLDEFNRELAASDDEIDRLVPHFEGKEAREEYEAEQERLGLEKGGDSSDASGGKYDYKSR